MSRTRSIEQTLELPAPPEAVFAALHTPSAIREWWQASRVIVIPEPGGTWCAAWGEEDDPDYVSEATLEEFRPPHRLVMSRFRYRAKSGPLPFEAEFRTLFSVEAGPNGSRLTVRQEGFPPGPEADAFFEGCTQGWTDTLAGLERYFTARTV